MYLVCVVMFLKLLSGRALSSALRIFCRPRSLCAIRRLLAGQYTPKPTVFLTPFSSGGINDPSMYMHCWGLNLRGWVWYILLVVVVLNGCFPGVHILGLYAMRVIVSLFS